MRLAASIILVLTFISCNNTTTEIIIDSNVDTAKSRNANKDSIDLVPGPFLTSDFPNTVRKILFASEDSMWNIISGFYSMPRRRGFAIDSFINTIRIQGFSLDTLDNGYLLWRRGFNRRTGIELMGVTVDTISVSNQMWYQGKKYILINDRSKYWSDIGQLGFDQCGF